MWRSCLTVRYTTIMSYDRSCSGSGTSSDRNATPKSSCMPMKNGARGCWPGCGMYAFVVVDHARKRTLAGRDPFGIKPLYYGRQGEQLLFASEIKALVRAGTNAIRAVPAGGYVDNGHASERQQFPNVPILEIDPEEAKSETRRLLEDSVRSMVDTDLPVAVLCGGGIDSSAVLYEAAKACKHLTVYAVGVSLEAPDVCAARCVARQLGVPFRPVIVDEASLLQSIPEVVACIESFEPNHIRGGTLSYALARAVHEDGIKIALCGEGADELLAGYPEFQEYLGQPGWEMQVQREVHRFTWELHKTQLQRVDRTNMAFAVEVRVPFLGPGFRLLRFVTATGAQVEKRCGWSANREMGFA